MTGVCASLFRRIKVILLQAEDLNIVVSAIWGQCPLKKNYPEATRYAGYRGLGGKLCGASIRVCGRANDVNSPAA